MPKSSLEATFSAHSSRLAKLPAASVAARLRHEVARGVSREAFRPNRLLSIGSSGRWEG